MKNIGELMVVRGDDAKSTPISVRMPGGLYRLMQLNNVSPTGTIVAIMTQVFTAREQYIEPGDNEEYGVYEGKAITWGEARRKNLVTAEAIMLQSVNGLELKAKGVKPVLPSPITPGPKRPKGKLEE